MTLKWLQRIHTFKILKWIFFQVLEKDSSGKGLMEIRTLILNIFQKSTYRLGQWNSAEEEKVHFTSEERKDLSSFGIPKLYNCVVVPQQPFVFWNKTKGSNKEGFARVTSSAHQDQELLALHTQYSISGI